MGSGDGAGGTIAAGRRLRRSWGSAALEGVSAGCAVGVVACGGCWASLRASSASSSSRRLPPVGAVAVEASALAGLRACPTRASDARLLGCWGLVVRVMPQHILHVVGITNAPVVRRAPVIARQGLLDIATCSGSSFCPKIRHARLDIFGGITAKAGVESGILRGCWLELKQANRAAIVAHGIGIPLGFLRHHGLR